MIFAGNMADALKWARAGFDSVAYSLDASIFTNACRALVKEFRGN